MPCLAPPGPAPLPPGPQVLAGLRLFPPPALAQVVAAAAVLDVKRDSSIDMLLDDVGR